MALLMSVSCEKDHLQQVSDELSAAQSAVDTRASSDFDIISGPGDVVLGAALNNPYALENVNAAYEALYDEPGSLVLRAFRGARFWNAFLKPAKHKWVLRSNSKRWNELCLELEDDSGTSKEAQSFAAAIANNGIHEYYDDFDINLPNPGRLRVLIHTLDESLNAAPMFRRMNANAFSLSDAESFLLAYSTTLEGLLYTYWTLSRPDIFLDFGSARASDRRRRTVYHEMVHASQFAQVGEGWWQAYVNYILTRPLVGQPLPYGDGSSPGAGRAELAEGMAESVELFFGDLKYGLSHSRGGNAQDRRYMNQAERLLFWIDEAEFIPEGLFFDLFDENGVAPPPAVLSALEPLFPPGNTVQLVDNAGGFTFEQQLNAFGVNVATVPDFRDALWQQSGPNGNTLFNYTQLFTQYGY